MTAKLTFFPVGNGDMTLVELESGRKILIDINIRAAADDEDDDTPDVAKMLRDRLDRDTDGRLYVDAFLMSHPDKDHCTGLEKHFHLGLPDDWSKKADKIFVREIWSSPMVFRRASSLHALCSDASAFNSEARRRVQRFRDAGSAVRDGDRILILGEDENGKTDNLTDILVKVDTTFCKLLSVSDTTFSARLLAPFSKSDDPELETLRSKNHSSTVINFSLTGDGQADACRFLSGGDAEVLIWECLWERDSTTPEHFSYDILQAPHHCSWHALSYDSWSEMGEDAKVSQSARKAFSQPKKGAVIVASSKPIKDDDNDPPCIRAKKEYESIINVEGTKGSFKCVGDRDEPLEFEIGKDGPCPRSFTLKKAAVIGAGFVGSQPLAHG